MKPGSVIVDLAVEQGGNVEGAVAGEIVVERSMASRSSATRTCLRASRRRLGSLSRNLFNFLSAFWDKEKNAPGAR
jgi:NAD(P) transhydrogenase subunit alpha